MLKSKIYQEKQGKEIQREKNRIRKIFSHENPKKGSVKYKSYLKQQAANCKIQKKSSCSH